MAAQILVMCTQCHRPQFATGRPCVACGAVLPEAPVSKEALKGREALLDQYDPFLEASVGAGRVILLSERRLEIRLPRRAPAVNELSELKRVTLRRRPAWEGLLIAALAAGLAAFAPWLWLQIGAALFALLGVISALTQKRYDFVVETPKGTGAFLLGIGSPKSALGQRVDSIWATLRPELQRLGVRVE